MDVNKLRAALEEQVINASSQSGGTWYVQVGTREIGFRPDEEGRIVIEEQDENGETRQHEFRITVVFCDSLVTR